MATSFGAGAARGIETGFGLGLRADAAAEEKRQRGAQEARQAQADTRAEEELRLRRSADQRAETRLQDAERRDATARATTALTGRRAELLAASTAAQSTGAPVPAGTAEEYATVSARLAKLRQAALDDASRLAAGQLDLGSMPPAQAFKAVTVGTGMTMKDLAGMPQHANDLQAGIETNNQGLTLQAVNGLFAPRLRQGVGEEAPSGGKITRKEVIRLVPAKDANGQMDPDKVFPVIRVYVQRPGDTQERYYDAPMTRGASVQDEQVEPISVKKSLDWVGNLGVLTTALQRPDIAEKMAQGEREVGPEVQKYFDEFYSLSKPSKKTTTREKTDMGDRVRFDTLDTSGNVTRTEYEKKGAAPRAPTTNAGLGLYRAKLQDINQAEESGDITSEDAAAQRRALTSGIRPSTANGGAGGGGGDGAGLSSKFKDDPEYAGQVDYWAKLVAAGGDLPARFGQSGAGKTMLPDVLQRVPSFSPDPRQQLANKAEYGGAKAGSRTVGQRSANFELAKSEAYAMADLVTEASRTVGRTDFIPVNKLLLAAKEGTGDVATVQFGAAINSFINAYARAVAPIGSPAQSEKEHARDMLNRAQSNDQVTGVIEQLKKEMIAAGQAPGDVRTKQREAVMSSAPELGPAPAPARGLGLQQPGGAAAPKAPPGVRTATNPKTGEKLMLQNGQWVPLK
jgi:hypothetical protein